MLKSIETAVIVKGRKNSVIAREIGRTAQGVCGWFNGRYPVPQRIRRALDAAIGAPVDWEAYDAEYAAKARASAPEKAEAAPPAPRPRAEAPAPAPRPAAPPQRPAADPWGAKPPPAPAPRRAAPAPAPAPRRGFLSALFGDGDALE